MKNTKDKILETALSLFNQHGLPKVTLRTIAKEMGISQGNLNYHFKKRAEIIEGLYFQLVEKMDKGVIDVQAQELSLKLMFDLQQFMMKNFYIYRFFLLDFVQIVRENERIKTHYTELTKQREEQFMGLLHILVNKKILREEILPNEYHFLYTRFQMLSEFWISSAMLVSPAIKKETVDAYFEIISQSIYPYLTAQGRRDYDLYNKDR